jgi:succinate-semialdehyde dehydrogenase / glutarate-semialdehyde dehydrogenase
MVSREQFEIVRELVDDAVANGATMHCGGPIDAPDGLSPDAAFYAPTVLTGVTHEMRIMREEIFGPVLPIIVVDSEDEAITLANDTPFGLGSYLMTNDPEQAERVANQIDAGMVYVNIVGADGAELPFGGTKRSGFGRELGRYGADEFVNKKLIRTG